MWLLVLGGIWTVANLVWSAWMQRRVMRLEEAEMERIEAETSTVVLRPKELRFKSLRPVPWEDAG